MTKISNFALKIKGVVGRVAHGKSSDPATPQNLECALKQAKTEQQEASTPFAIIKNT